MKAISIRGTGAFRLAQLTGEPTRLLVDDIDVGWAEMLDWTIGPTSTVRLDGTESIQIRARCCKIWVYPHHLVRAAMTWHMDPNYVAQVLANGTTAELRAVVRPFLRNTIRFSPNVLDCTRGNLGERHSPVVVEDVKCPASYTPAQPDDVVAAGFNEFFRKKTAEEEKASQAETDLHYANLGTPGLGKSILEDVKNPSPEPEPPV